MKWCFTVAFSPNIFNKDGCYNKQIFFFRFFFLLPFWDVRKSWYILRLAYSFTIYRIVAPYCDAYLQILATPLLPWLSALIFYPLSGSNFSSILPCTNLFSLPFSPCPPPFPWNSLHSLSSPYSPMFCFLFYSPHVSCFFFLSLVLFYYSFVTKPVKTWSFIFCRSRLLFDLVTLQSTVPVESLFFFLPSIWFYWL